jgi:hypothetical protein
MAVALTKLKGFVQTYTSMSFGNISEAELDELKSFVSQALSMLRWEIEDDLNNLADDSEKGIYIINLQSQLTYLADGITGFDRDDKSEMQITGLFDWLLTSLFELLEHVRNYFAGFFDFDAELPTHFFIRYKPIHADFGYNLEEALIKNNVDQELSSLILGFSRSTDKSERFKIRTWRQWDYLIKTVQVISQFWIIPQKRI